VKDIRLKQPCFHKMNWQRQETNFLKVVEVNME
jgi:hypothetical protein